MSPICFPLLFGHDWHTAAAVVVADAAGAVVTVAGAAGTVVDVAAVVAAPARETYPVLVSDVFGMFQLQLKNTATYIVSGLLMIAVFFVVRILVFPFLYWRYSLHAGQPLLAVPGTIPIKCNLGCLLILVLQVYFLALMVRGAARVFFKIHQQRQTAQKSR